MDNSEAMISRSCASKLVVASKKKKKGNGYFFFLLLRFVDVDTNTLV